MTYEFQGTLHSSSTQAHRAIAGEWLSAGGMNHRPEIEQALAESTDPELAAECSVGWGMSEVDWFDLGDLIRAFADIRANPADAFGWED